MSAVVEIPCVKLGFEFPQNQEIYNSKCRTLFTFSKFGFISLGIVGTQAWQVQNGQRLSLLWDIYAHSSAIYSVVNGDSACFQIEISFQGSCLHSLPQLPHNHLTRSFFIPNLYSINGKLIFSLTNLACKRSISQSVNTDSTLTKSTRFPSVAELFLTMLFLPFIIRFCDKKSLR